MLLGLGIGTLGGGTAFYLQLPLAWMLGALTFTTVAALAGAPIAMTSKLRSAMVSVLGVLLGSAFMPDLFSRAGQWLVSVAGLAVYIGLTGVVTFTYLRRFGPYGPVTSYFTAMPGGLNEMVAVGTAMGGDDRIISLSHAWRLVLVVLTIPFWFRMFGGYTVPAAPVSLASLADKTVLDGVLLIGSAVFGGIGARAVRLPAANLSGPMLLSAAAHFSGLTTMSPPSVLVSAAQVVIGTSLGARFAGISLGRLWHTTRIALGAAVLMLGVTVVCAWSVHLATGIPARQVLLAYAPGGLAEMSLIALSLDIDAAYVSTHHILRILFVIGIAPLVFRLLAASGVRVSEDPAPGD